MNETQIPVSDLFAGDRVVLGNKVLKTVDTVYDEPKDKFTVFFDDNSSQEFSLSDRVFILDDLGESMEKFTHRNRDDYES